MQDGEVERGDGQLVPGDGGAVRRQLMPTLQGLIFLVFMDVQKTHFEAFSRLVVVDVLTVILFHPIIIFIIIF